MKKYKYPVYSNGTEFDMWVSRNCDRCVKASRYNENTDTYTNFRCAVNREIIMAYLGDGRASERTCNICQNAAEIENSSETPYKEYYIIIAAK